MTEDADIERLADLRQQAAAYRHAARRALAFARAYRTEEGPGGERERACVAQALIWRRKAWRAGPRAPLARTRADAAADSRRTG